MKPPRAGSRAQVTSISLGPEGVITLDVVALKRRQPGEAEIMRGAGRKPIGHSSILMTRAGLTAQCGQTKGDGPGAVALLLFGYFDRGGLGFREPISQPETFANLSTFAAGLLGLRGSRRRRAEGVFIHSNAINHVGYFHQDQFPFSFVVFEPSFSLNDANLVSAHLSVM